MRHHVTFSIALVAALAAALPAAAAPPAATASSAAPTTAVTRQTVIHPGDQLNVQVFGQQSLSQTVTVAPDGSVDYPLIGHMQVGGMTIEAATNSIHNKLLKFVRQPNVTIAIAQLAQPTVLVLGNVKTPGKYQLRSDARITDAIAAAGGIADVNGALPEARVSDSSGNVSTVSLQKLLHDGDMTTDKNLSEGSVVYVPGPVTLDVVVEGAVDHPGDVQVSEGDHLSMAIAKAGNSANANADLNNIRVLRNMPDGSRQQLNVNLYKALEHNDSSADPVLQKGDVVYVPQARQKSNFFANPLLYLLGRLIP